MRSEDEIRERIKYLEQCVIKDVTEGLISINALNSYRTEIRTLKYILQEDNQ